MCMDGGRTGEEGIISGVSKGRQTKMVERVLTVPSVLAGMPSVSTMRRSSSRLASTSPSCGPRWRKRSRCDIATTCKIARAS
jgi:hypothetical protein